MAWLKIFSWTVTLFDHETWSFYDELSCLVIVTEILICNCSCSIFRRSFASPSLFAPHLEIGISIIDGSLIGLLSWNNSTVSPISHCMWLVYPPQWIPPSSWLQTQTNNLIVPNDIEVTPINAVNHVGDPCILDLSIPIRSKFSKNSKSTELHVSINIIETLQLPLISRSVSNVSSWGPLRPSQSCSEKIISTSGSESNSVRHFSKSALH